MEGHAGSTCTITATVLIFLVLLSFDDKANATARSNPNKVVEGTQFLQTSCSSTSYPRLCLTSLAPYASKIKASPAELAQAALTVSLGKAKSTSRMLSKLSVADGMSRNAAADCATTMADSMVMLQKSLDTVGHLRSKNLRRHMGNLLTWVSTALTDLSACMDAFPAATATTESGTKVTAVKGQVVNAIQLTSNSLSLVNGLASTVPAKQKHL